MSPILSVIVTAYKFENYIVQCIDSILSQSTNFEFEILVRDDFSGDNTERILLERYSQNPKVKIFLAEENLKPYGNIKFLLERSSGKYVSILDGDDYLSNPFKLQMQIEFLEANPEYVMHATGYSSLLPDGKFDPEDFSRMWCPLKNDVETKDLIDKNIVTFGRTFRNIPGIMEEWMRDFEFLDWAFNYRISHHGKIKCEDWRGGIYRHHGDGIFSLMSKKEKREVNRKCKEIIKERHRIHMKKTNVISIIDCFVHDEKVKNNLSSAIDRLKNHGHDVLLVSNTTVSQYIIDKVDYYLYDKRNQLFKKEYENVQDVDFWTNYGEFTVHNVKSGLQKHGLSVLINLFNSIDLAKNLGYRYFQRFETDDLYGEKSMDFIKSVPHMIDESGKKGLFYLNPANTPADASFHYFFCEIDHFLNIMSRISCEDDYVDYLYEIQDNVNFRIVETYLYDHIMTINSEHQDQLILRDGVTDMNSDFPDTVWNTVVSASNLPSVYGGCLSGIYKVLDKEYNTIRYSIYSSNYVDVPAERKIKVIFSNGSVDELEHNLSGKGAWAINYFDEKPDSIEVYQRGNLLYIQRDENSNSYIQMN